ncbi:hypothetical protein ACI797_00315 [Geodermatophilus sp. SYSU D00691]
MTEDGFIPLAELAFDIDETEADRATTEVIDDETLRLLRRDNRVALARAVVRPVTGPAVGPGRSAFEVPLLFVVHAHPECKFVWSRLMIDLSPTPDCVIADMAPREVQDLAVDVETSVGLDLSFSIVANAVDLGAKPELARKRTVYFPELLASGVGFHKAAWDFLAKAGDYLHTDKELRLLVDAPADTSVTADVVVRAKVKFRGLPRLIPLLARTAHSETRIRLA